MSKPKRYLGIFNEIKFWGSKPEQNIEYVKCTDKRENGIWPEFELWVPKESETK